LHGLSNPEDINLLEEIPPQDRQFVLDIYKLYKQKTLTKQPLRKIRGIKSGRGLQTAKGSTACRSNSRPSRGTPGMPLSTLFRGFRFAPEHQWD